MSVLRPLLAVAIVISSSSASSAQGQHPPPTEAVDACKGKKASEACEVTFGDDIVAGTCGATPTGRLICQTQSVPEVVKACEGKEEGASCSAKLGSRTLNGKCQRPREGGETLLCRRARPAGARE